MVLTLIYRDERLNDGNKRNTIYTREKLIDEICKRLRRDFSDNTLPGISRSNLTHPIYLIEGVVIQAREIGNGRDGYYPDEIALSSENEESIKSRARMLGLPDAQRELIMSSREAHQYL